MNVGHELDVPSSHELADATLAYVKLIMASDPYKAWAKTQPLEALKIEGRLAGFHTPSLRSRFGIGLAGIIGSPVVPTPPPPPPPPPPGPPVPLGALDPLWLRDGVFVRRLSSFSGVQRDAARAAGFSRIEIQLDHTADVEANEYELAVAGNILRSQGWVLSGWGTYGQDTDPHEDGMRQAAIVTRHGLAGWKADGESWAEFADQPKSRAWLEGWSAAGGRGPIAVSCLSSTTPNYARSFDYQVWLGVPGCAIEPQVYGASNPAYTIVNALATLAHAGVPVSRTTLSLNVVAGDGPFADYRTWQGPRTVWTGDDSTPATFAALAR